MMSLQPLYVWILALSVFATPRLDASECRKAVNGAIADTYRKAHMKAIEPDDMSLSMSLYAEQKGFAPAAEGQVYSIAFSKQGHNGYNDVTLDGDTMLVVGRIDRPAGYTSTSANAKYSFLVPTWNGEDFDDEDLTTLESDRTVSRNIGTIKLGRDGLIWVEGVPLADNAPNRDQDISIAHLGKRIRPPRNPTIWHGERLAPGDTRLIPWGQYREVKFGAKTVKIVARKEGEIVDAVIVDEPVVEEIKKRKPWWLRNPFAPRNVDSIPPKRDDEVNPYAPPLADLEE